MVIFYCVLSVVHAASPYLLTFGMRFGQAAILGYVRFGEAANPEEALSWVGVLTNCLHRSPLISPLRTSAR